MQPLCGRHTEALSLLRERVAVGGTGKGRTRGNFSTSLSKLENGAPRCGSGNGIREGQQEVYV